jgi:hypothetical protein
MGELFCQNENNNTLQPLYPGYNPEFFTDYNDSSEEILDTPYYQPMPWEPNQ